MKKKFGDLKNESNKKYKLALFLCWVGSILLFTGAAFTTGSFVGAMTPDQVLQEGYPPLPPGWEAGVFQHGEFYRWVTIRNHPMLFGISISAWLSSIFFWRYYSNKLRHFDPRIY